jgi:hypothetical protein
VEQAEVPELKMPEPTRYVGNSVVVEAGAVLLGPDDESFQIQFSGLSVLIRFLHSWTAPPISTERIDETGMRVTLNTYQTNEPTFKTKVGSLWGKDLFLAIRVEERQNFRTLTYTFSMKG